MPGGDVARLDERDRKAARGGVERDAGAGDAAADHEQVEPLLPHPLERPRPRGGVKHALIHSRPHVHLEGVAPAGALACPAGGVELRLHPVGDRVAGGVGIERVHGGGGERGDAAGGRLEVASDLERQPGEVGHGLQQHAVGRQAAADAQHVDPARCRLRLQGIGDLVGDAGQPGRSQVGSRRGARRADHGDAVGAVPVRRPQPGRRRHDHGMRPPPLGRPRRPVGRDQAAPAQHAERVAGVGAERLERIRAAFARGLPGDRGEHALRRVGPLGAGVQPHERAGAERERGHPRRRAALAVERRGLVAQHGGDRRLETHPLHRCPQARPVRVAHHGQDRRRHAEQVEQARVPLASTRRPGAGCGRRWTARSRGRRRPRGARRASRRRRRRPARPICARASRAGSRSNSQASFGAENVGSSARPVTAATRDAAGSAASDRHSSSAR